MKRERRFLMEEIESQNENDSSNLDAFRDGFSRGLVEAKPVAIIIFLAGLVLIWWVCN